ncbi:K02A2.6-like [Cordylochernes scorpioides]|uniref:K02A2.6-like n=1 Tax=Cordylochernes scorpioides TaxID=51811 RepID=A0ABY6L0F6_9ARAC|nr:K02A2.6-like [Cordylochernes scorpioides]
MEGIKPPAEFVPYSNEKKWETWRESFEIFAIAVNLESMPLVRQRAILKHIAGEKTVMIYKTFHISENDTYPNVKEMLDMLTNHFKPFKNTIQRRNAFFTCVQKEKQGIMEFVTELKHLAQECEFENLTESLIRDRLIIGILDREVKRKLLEDPQLTLPRAISIAVISESTCSQVASLNEQKMIEKIEKRNWVKDTIRMENAEAGPSGINPRRERIIEPLVCRTKRIRNLLAESEAEESCDEINLNEVAVKTVRSDKWSAVIIINGKKTTVHLDTGAQINVLPHKVINQWPSRPEIRPTSLKAFAYGNTELPIVGKCNVLCQYGEKKGMFEFIVADVEAQTLITGDTCEKLEILRRINHINTDEMKLCSETQKILEQYHEVFQGVGLINSECKIYTKPEYSPVQVPPRRIPTSLGAEVQSELEKMVKQGIVTKIYHETEWSHPMVVVKKKSGQIRICLDPRKLNEALVGRHFQTPAPAELLHEIPKAKYYTVLDVKSAYWHIPVAKECRDLLVMTTPFGKFRYNRLPFGLKISAQIFVEKMTNIFRDSFQNITYVDDLLIYADTIQEHNKKLKGILEKAKEKYIKFDLTKAQICLTKVRFLGHVISQNGIDPEPNKIDKLITFKRPEDKKSLQRIMGLYNYLGKFIPNLAASTSNIRGILRKNVVWHWGPKQDGEFDHIKECVRNAPSLAHFDKSKMLILQCDASKDAMGAALLQEDRPLAFASASFSDSQKQYSQIEKELLSVYYGCKKFEYLLSGHTFVVQTDHQPLLPLVKKPLSDISPRLQRLVMKLIAFDFKLQYKPGKYLIVADTLSRDTHPMDELPTPFLEDKRMVKMLCLSRSLRCQIPRITPLYRPYQTNWRSIENAKRKRQSSMKEQYDRNSKSYPKVNVGEDAWCQIHPRETWTPVKISAQADSPQSFEVVTPSGNRLIRNQQFIRPRDGGYEKSQLSSEPITASPEAQHPQCYSPTMGESSTAPIQRSSEETNIDQREGATTSAGIAPEPSGRPRFSRTISRRLVANGLHSCRPLRRLPLTPPNRRQRLEWCRARSTWMTEWHRVVFSDESRFCLSSDSRRVRVWRRRGERSNPAAIVERPTVRQRGIMVWGAIAYDSRSPLLRIQGTMTAQRYVDDVLRPVTLPYLQGVPNALYQQDNARPHTARISQQALQDVQMPPWPPYSPDLSPIEPVWDIIGRRLHALPQPRSEDELWQMGGRRRSRDIIRVDSIDNGYFGSEKTQCRLVPQDLTFDQKNARKETASLNLEATTDDPELLKRVITGDETWNYRFDSETTQQASEWRFKNEPKPKKARKAPSKVKVMLTVFFDYQGIVHNEFQQQGSTITADSYLGVLRRLREAIRQKRPSCGGASRGSSTTITHRRTQP